MIEVKLGLYGFPEKVVPLDVAPLAEGAEHRVEGAPLVFLNEENHADEEAIRRSQRNVLRLIDDGIVDFVGVEASPTGVEDFILSLARLRGLKSVPEFVESLVAGRAVDDVIGNQQQLWGRVMFAPTVAVLRPGTPVESVEDPVLYERARTAMKSQKETRFNRIMEMTFALMKEQGIGPKEMTPAIMLDLRGTALARLEAQEKEYMEKEVEKPRNSAFVSNLIQKRQAKGATRVMFLNLGRQHMDDVARLLRERGDTSYIRLNPA